MSEDVSSQVRLGVTILMLASLVAVALNLLTIAQSIVSTGIGTLQTATDSIKAQEYELYNQQIKTGTEVKTALKLYTARDNCIVIRTTNSMKNGKAFCYGSMLTGFSSMTDTATNTTSYYLPDNYFSGTTYKKAGESFYTMEYGMDSYGVVQYYLNIKPISAQGNDQFILESAHFRAELIKNKTGTVVGIVFTQVG